MILDEAYFKSLTIHEVPRGHLFCMPWMRINYQSIFGVDIQIEGLENLPKDKSVFLALNHTDVYTAWPLQFALIEAGGHRYTSTWVKAKYFKNPITRWVLGHCNGIPVPSLGYVILSEAKARLGRMLTEDEYRVIKLASERDPTHPITQVYERLMSAFESKTLQALRDRKNHVIVFPQGTRSKRLLPSRLGVIQMAYQHQIPIVPIGANGVDQLYPGLFPWARRGKVVYRIGKPFFPKTPQDGLELTRAINELLDPAYQLEDISHFKPWAANRLL